MRRKLIIIGDFNVNLLNDISLPVQRLTTFMRSNYLALVINHAKRYPHETDKNPTLFDHIWMNFMGDIYNSGFILHYETDHCPAFHNVKTNYTNETTTKIKF